MRNNDGYKLLYNQLWLSKNEMPDYLEKQNVKTAQIAQADSASRDAYVPAPAKFINESISTTELSLLNKNQAVIENQELKTNLNLVHDKITNQTKSSSGTIKSAQQLINSWDVLTDLINNCTDCKLCHRRKNLVIERGSRNAKWMFVGEAPGENEDLEGKPFVGSAGQLLDKMLLAMKLDKDNDVYICNVVKCRPPQNRNPEIDEIEACNNYLLSQIALVNPQIIVALGRIAAHTLLNTTQATTKLRQQIHHISNNIPVVVTYHPAYLLRNPSAKKDTWEDLQLAMKTFANL